MPGTDDGAVGVFAHLPGSPGDRNLIPLYADTAGLSDPCTGTSTAARRTARLERAALGASSPIRSSELPFETSD